MPPRYHSRWHHIEKGAVVAQAKPHYVFNFKNKLVKTYFADCSLRQGAGGAESARLGSRTCFLRCFYKRSQTYFDQKPEEHCFSIKKRCLEIKNDDF